MDFVACEEGECLYNWRVSSPLALVHRRIQPPGDTNCEAVEVAVNISSGTAVPFEILTGNSAKVKPSTCSDTILITFSVAHLSIPKVLTNLPVNAFLYFV